MPQVGSAVVTRGTDSRLALGRLGALAEQIEALVRSGRQVILVTSGAVAVGKQRLRQQQVLNSTPKTMQIQGSTVIPSAPRRPAWCWSWAEGLHACDNVPALQHLLHSHLGTMQTQGSTAIVPDAGAGLWRTP